MSNDGAKRLSLLLNLNPTISKADRYAIGVLQRWYRQAKYSHSDPADLEASVKGFHRDIYLAGLFLHQLKHSTPILFLIRGAMPDIVVFLFLCH